MLRSISVIAPFVALVAVAAPARAAEIPPDSFLCFMAGSAGSKKLSPISGAVVEVEDRFGDQRFAMRRLATLCNPAGIDGGARSHDTIHLVGVTIKKEKAAPKPVPFTLGVTDRFGTRQLQLTTPSAVFDVTPVQPGTNAPADFSDDPTRSSVEVNRFKCYVAVSPKGAPKITAPPPVTIVDEAFPAGQTFLVRKPTKVCLPADVEDGTPGAEMRGDILVCWSAKLPSGAKFLRQTVGTRSRSLGVRIVGRRKPSEICFAGRLFPGG